MFGNDSLLNGGIGLLGGGLLGTGRGEAGLGLLGAGMTQPNRLEILGAILQDLSQNAQGKMGLAVPAMGNRVQRLNQQEKYKQTVDQLLAPGTPQTAPTFTPGSLTGTVEVRDRKLVPAANPSYTPPTMTDPGNPGMPGGAWRRALGDAEADNLSAALAMLPPQEGLKLGLETVRDAGKEQREIERSRVVPASAEWKRANGFDPMTPVFLNANGEPTIKQDPLTITPYQKETLADADASRAVQWANHAETVRNNKASERAKQNPFGYIGDTSATGDDFLKSLPVGVANQVKAIASYRQAPPPNRTTAAGLAIMNAVNQYNPSYDASQYGAKVRARNDFSTGKNGNTVRSLNVAVQHLEQLGGLVEALGNGNIQQFNRLGQIVAQQSGRAAPTNFDATKKIVADEIVKAVVGTSGGVYDREEVASTINRASSPAQLRGVIKEFQGIMGGQLSGFKCQYEKTTGLQDFDEFIDPLTRERLKSHSGEKPGAGGVAGGVKWKIVQ